MRKRSEARAAKNAENNEGVDTPPATSERSDDMPKDGSDPRPAPMPFQSANRRVNPDADLRSDLDQIVETVFIDDMKGTWDRIRASLTIAGDRSSHAVLHKHVADARNLSYDAHRLYVTAKREYERWELENAPVFAAMWNEAERALQDEKENKIRAKNITDTDIRSKIMATHPDEYKAQENKRRSVKLTVDNLQQLVKDANEHVDDLKVMLGKLRSQG